MSPDMSLSTKEELALIRYLGGQWYELPTIFRRNGIEELLDILLACKEAYEDPTCLDLCRALCFASIGDKVMEKELQIKILIGEYFAYLEVLSARGISPETLSEEELKKLSLPDLRTLVQRTRDLARTPSRG